jgi:excinuclease ABC subunit A
MANFSFNKPAVACPTCTGLDVVSDAQLHLLVDESLSVSGRAVRV